MAKEETKTSSNNSNNTSNSTYLVAIVAIVAVVGLVVLFSGMKAAKYSTPDFGNSYLVGQPYVDPFNQYRENDYEDALIDVVNWDTRNSFWGGGVISGGGCTRDIDCPSGTQGTEYMGCCRNGKCGYQHTDSPTCVIPSSPTPTPSPTPTTPAFGKCGGKCRYEDDCTQRGCKICGPPYDSKNNGVCQ